MGEGVAVLDGVVTGGLIEKMAFEQKRPET